MSLKLDYPIKDNFRLAETQKSALKKLGLETLRDLLFYFPSRYIDPGEKKEVGGLVGGETATIYAKVLSAKTRKSFRSKIPIAEARLSDATGSIKAVWFNQPYIAKMVKPGEYLRLSGKISKGRKELSIVNPEYEKVEEIPAGASSIFAEGDSDKSPLYPVYPETRGLTSKWIFHAVEKIIKDGALEEARDYVPAEILKKYNLPSLKTALIWIHMPKRKEDAVTARKRFAFEEVFFIQLERQHDKLEYSKNKSFQIKPEADNLESFLSRFPFRPTRSQEKAIKEIISDLGKTAPMARLLEGDVGSGKTLVAAAAAYAAVATRPKGQDFGRLEVAYMAPTEILAVQHFESFIQYFKHLNINIGLITGSGCRKFPSKVNPAGWTDISRAQLLKWVANGEIPILLGTHALIQKTVKFKNLALVIVDEQHRFGVNQRMKLAKKSVAPHFLSMTATPIPRTLALTIYGDLDLSLLEEMPSGRKQVITEIVAPEKRNGTYEKIRKELTAGRQAYVICPRIEEKEAEYSESDNLHAPEGLAQVNEPSTSEKSSRILSRARGSMRVGAEQKSVNAEAKRLKKEIFSEYEIGVLHSKMSKDKKEKTMKDFAEGKIRILCATSVVEVGVNVPNATVILIEGAERFGLAQLHQLRGRVQRSTHQSYCYLFAESRGEKALERLKALKTAKNGFELSELDLSLRGAGELSGGKQWGVSDLAMEAIKNIKMVEAARNEAQNIIAADPELDGYPLLKSKIKSKLSEFHFE